MLQVGYISLDSPIAIISSEEGRGKYNGSASLLIIDRFDLDVEPLSDVESAMKNAGTTSSLGFSVKCSNDEPLIEAARFAGKNLYLMDLDFSREFDPERSLDLVKRIKRCGTTLSVRVRPGMLSGQLAIEMKEAGLDLIHLDLTGMNGQGPGVIKRTSDAGSPMIMALGDIGEFEDAKDLLAMGADMVSMKGADPEFAGWLSNAMKEYDDLSGWYNAPKHICSGGDLRGLSFCCPPVKHCPVLGALKKAGFTPDEFVERKLQLAKGTPLEKGEGTCFGSLVWCCKVTKPCYLRDAALRKAGLSDREYMRLKRKLSEKLLKA